MKWEKFEDGYAMPVKSWCENCEEGAVKQAVNLAHHPALVHHVALMPDAHQGYGMPIGGVVAAKGGFDLSEAPQAYKDIEDVIASELDLVEPLVRLVPLASLKG